MEDKSSYVDATRQLSITQLDKGTRSIIFSMVPLFMDEQLFKTEDYSLFENMLGRFNLPEDVEVYQAVSQILKSRFEEQATALIDSLAMEGNVALNRTLLQQGWDILQGDSYPPEFRSPEWDELKNLGPYPVLVLETKKGDISMQLDVLRAPATIAGINQLIEARAYNGIPIHRVVPNFVIQGGDVESQNGMGGPDYTVPTEASSDHFTRGKIGIASSGPDTEGSQYFVMHQWAPHLNGRYSIIGEVIDGMSVVDRIVVGDVIQRMYWD